MGRRLMKRQKTAAELQEEREVRAWKHRRRKGQGTTKARITPVQGVEFYRIHVRGRMHGEAKRGILGLELLRPEARVLATLYGREHVTIVKSIRKDGATTVQGQVGY